MNDKKMIEADKLASCIDQTILKPDASLFDIDGFAAGFWKYHFLCACVNSCWIGYVRGHIPAGTKICSVVGFPLGACHDTVKMHEARELVALGCDEIDMVMNIGRFRSGDYDYVGKEISAVVSAAEGRVVKVIIETCLLDEQEKESAARLVKESGAHFVKTSTGFSTGGATVEDVKLLRNAVGVDFGVKASGGIRDHAFACALIKAGASRIGTSAGVAIMKEAWNREG
ncbi:MAG TPA: deoxyribose-phosphate aldolase [bacterium]